MLARRENSARKRKGRVRPEACRTQVSDSVQAVGQDFLSPVVERK